MLQTNDISAVILAAGSSTRMGQMKQLLELGGIPLLERVIRQVCTFPFAKTVAVVGDRDAAIREAVTVNDKRLSWSVNAEYADGQSTSLKKGMAAAHTSHVMVFLGDQPFITDETIQTVYAEGESLG